MLLLPVADELLCVLGGLTGCQGTAEQAIRGFPQYLLTKVTINQAIYEQRRVMCFILEIEEPLLKYDTILSNMELSTQSKENSFGL